MRGRRLLAGAAALVILTGPGCQSDGNTGREHLAVIRVDTSTRFQTITAWEAVAQAGQEDAPYYGAVRDTLLGLAANELGITRLRLWLRSGYEHGVDIWAEKRAGRRREFNCSRFTTQNDNDDPFVINPNGFHFSQLDHAIDSLVLPLKKLVEANGEKLALNANYVAFMKLCPRGTPYHHDTPEEYAEFVLAAYLHLRDKYGLIPDAWEVILEPENTYFWGGRQIGEAMIAAARRLRDHGFTPRFIAPSTTKAGNAPKYFTEISKVPGALVDLEEISYHRYRGVSAADIAAIRGLGTKHQINTAMLEHIGSGYEDLHQDLRVGNVSSWQQFALAYPLNEDNGGQYILIRNSGSPQAYVELTKTASYLRQYFRYIRPGAVRVAAHTTLAVADPVAFIGPGQKAVVVMKTKQGLSALIRGLPNGTYGVRYTTAHDDHVAAPDVAVTRGEAKVAIPAQGVLTLFRK